ncbi:hypothetical protein B0H11DRAFT_2031151, partial [Mycena galericulata]
MVFSPYLNWILWIEYYFSRRLNVVPSVHQIHRGIIWCIYNLSFSLGALDPLDVTMVFGPLITHVAATCLGTIFLILVGTPRATRVVVRELLPDIVSLAYSCILKFCIASLICAALFAEIQYDLLHPNVQELLWQSISCPQSRTKVAEIWQLMIQRYLNWKLGEIEEFKALMGSLRHSFGTAGTYFSQTWGTFDWFETSVSLVLLCFSRFDHSIVHCSARCHVLRLFLRHTRRSQTFVGDTNPAPSTTMIYPLLLFFTFTARFENRLAAATRRPGEVSNAAPNTYTLKRSAHGGSQARMPVRPWELLGTPYFLATSTPLTSTLL